MKFKFNIGQPFFTFEARQVPGSLISRLLEVFDFIRNTQLRDKVFHSSYFDLISDVETICSRFSYGDFKVSLSHTSASSLEGFDNVFSVDLFIHVS